MIIVVMGVAGSGKTTIGTMLADSLGCAWIDGDALHSTANIEAMTRGVALTDADRAPWLSAIHDRMVDAFERGRSLVVGCSALRESYRAILSAGLPVTWVYLNGSAELIRSRLLQRTGHFMAAAMLDSQFDTLEQPHDAIVVDISLPPRVIVEHVLARLIPDDEHMSTNDIRVQASDVRVAADLEELGGRVADAAATTIRDVVQATGRCSIALSGGTTPRGFYRILGSRFRDTIPWSNVHVFWSDERCVPHEDVRSNYRMARETLLDHVACPSANVHPMPDCTADPAHAAREYEDTLREYFAGAPPAFDLSILGLGADGHTASLFPGAPALHERARWVLPVIADAEPPSRLTLTLPALTESARTWFVVSGSNKAVAVRRVLNGAHTSSAASASARARAREPQMLPASVLMRRVRGALTWWLDRDAAAQLDTAGTTSPSSTVVPLPSANDDDAID